MTSSFIIMTVTMGVVFAGVVLFLNYKMGKSKKTQIQTLINDRGASRKSTNSLHDDLDTPQNDDANNTAKNQAQQKKFTRKLKGQGGTDYSQPLNPKSIKYMLIQAGTETPVFMFWVYSVICCVAVILIAKVFGASQPLLVMWGIIGFLGLPRFILKKKVAKRQQKFLADFADCLEAMIRLLKSGMPISEAIAMTSREYEGPIGEEMTKVYEAQRVGDTMPEAVEKLAFRVPMPEVKMFSTAITIQTQTGSSLSEVLENLANVIRQRFRLKRKVQALSAEAKISAGIIGCLPLVVIGGMYFTNPDYISLLWQHHTGKLMMYGGMAWMGIGMLIMRQMINFRI